MKCRKQVGSISSIPAFFKSGVFDPLLKMHAGVDFLGLVVLKTSKGRDKLLAFIQNFSKLYSLRFDVGSKDWAVWREVENNLSDGECVGLE